jgi:subtilisin-like proprotein convertase family protein
MLGVWDDDVCLSCWDTNYGDKEIHFHSFTLTLYSAYLSTTSLKCRMSVYTIEDERSLETTRTCYSSNNGLSGPGVPGYLFADPRTV